MKSIQKFIFSTAILALGATLLFSPVANGEEGKTKLNRADEKFILKESAAGLTLVKMAEAGEKQAKREEVKAFAAMLLADHSKANTELANLAASKGVTIPAESGAEDADRLKEIEATNATEFDDEFLTEVVSIHEKCVKNLEKAATDAEDGDVKAWAAKMLPGVRAHLEKAEELGSEESAETGTTSDREAPAKSDNTARNMRDRDQNTLTPLDQGNSKADIDMTAGIRRAIVEMEDLSVNAQNVKIITNAGRVTLRGPVESADEKRILGEIATGLATAESVDNQLEISNATTEN